MSQIAGYTAADYLIQIASRERRSVRMPATTWESILSHVGDPADAARLADSARDRLLSCYAVPLYRHAADAGDRNAALVPPLNMAFPPTVRDMAGLPTKHARRSAIEHVQIQQEW